MKPSGLVPFVVLLTMATVAPAQTTIGLRGGVSVARVGGDVEDAGARTGLTIGVALAFPIARSVAVETGASYIQKGTRGTKEGLDFGWSLDYVQVPLLLRLQVPGSESLTPLVVLGPALGFNTQDVGVKALDIGAIVGVGLEIVMSGPLRWTLAGLYERGLSSVADSASPYDVKFRTWSILAGAALPIGRTGR